jgi:hypothetical protein
LFVQIINWSNKDKEFFTKCLVLASLSSSACRNGRSYYDSAPVESVRG